MRFNDTLCLSLKDHSLKRLETTGEPSSERTYHASTLINDYMAVIGGEARTDQGDFHLLNLVTKKWE